MVKFSQALLAVLVGVEGTPHPALERQRALDESRPDLGPQLTEDSESEVVFSSAGDHTITLRRLLQRIPEDSVSFSIHHYPMAVITYYPDEAAMSNLRTSKMLGAELSPDIQYVSPPSASSLHSCAKTENQGRVRFMIRERFGNFISEVSSVSRRFAGLANAARHLKRMHLEFGLFHGSIGPHSVLIDKNGDARLIHLHHSGHIADDAPPPSSGKSIYALRGAGDDLFKLLFSVANFPAWEEDYWVWAQQDVDVFHSMIESLDLRARVRNLISLSVQRLLRFVRNIELVVPYDEIIAEFETVAALADIENHLYWPTLNNSPSESRPLPPSPEATLVEYLQDDAVDDPTQSFDYEYSPSLLAKLVNPNSQLSDFLLLSQQLDRDKSFPIPKLFHRHELIVTDYDDDDGPYLRIELGEPLSEGALSTVHDLASHPDWVVKYQSNCDANLNKVHPLITEFNFLKQLEGLGVTPRVIYLSRPAELVRPMFASPKTSFVNKPHFLKACRKRLDMHVRFMVLEKVYLTFHDVEQGIAEKNEYFPISFAIALMLASVEALETIHLEDIVHGDVHAGNLAVLDQTTHSVGLIDFGRAKSTASDLYYLEGGERIAQPLVNVHVMNSPFEMDGFKSSFRDDIYRALEIGANQVSGGKLYTYMDSLTDSNNHQLLFEYKASGDLFRVPGASLEGDRIDLRAGLTQAEKKAMRNALREAIALVRQIPSIYQRPDYVKIKECLTAAHELAFKSDRFTAAAASSAGETLDV